MNNNRMVQWWSIILLMASVLWIAGCKDNSTNPNSDATANEDAAETIAAAMGDDNGGAMDQIGDVTDLASSTGIVGKIQANGLAKSENGQSFVKVYNATTQKWTGVLFRVKISSMGYGAWIYRKMEWQFKKGAVPQQNFITSVDTASSIDFKILEGKASAKTPKLNHTVDSLTASWTITNTNTPTVTINGNVYRSAYDTVTTRNVTRTLRNFLSLTYTNVTATRGNRATVASTASGTVTGTFDATVTFLKGTSYSEKTIHRDINVTFSGGTGSISVGGKTFNCNMGIGMLK